MPILTVCEPNPEREHEHELLHLETMSERPHISASQVETYRLCPRKWGINKIDGIKDPGSKYTEFGTDLHSVVEHWLRDGTEIPDTKVGKIALAGSKYWPDPGTCEVERYFEIEEAGVRLIGYIDVYQGGAKSTRIIDHKTTSDFKWMKTPAVLKDNVQAMIYAHYGMSQCTEPEPEADLHWIYYQRSRASSRKVQLRVLPEELHTFAVPDEGVRPEHFGCITPEHVAEQWAGILKDGAEMVDLRLSGEAGSSLKPIESACGAYGGCPYFDKECKVNPQKYLGAVMAQNSLAAKMRAKLSKKESEKPEEPKPETAKAQSVPAEKPETAGAGEPKGEKPKAAGGKLKLNKGAQDAAKAAKKEAAKKEAAKPSAAPKGTNAPETPYSSKITPYQGHAWDIAKEILVERAKAGQDLDPNSVCHAVSKVAATIKGLD